MQPRAHMRLIGVALLVLGLVLSWQWVSEFWEVDRCLDAGGSYNYIERRCDFTTSHGPALSSGLNFQEMLGLVLLGLGLGAILRSFRRHAL